MFLYYFHIHPKFNQKYEWIWIIITLHYIKQDNLIIFKNDKPEVIQCRL